MTRKGKARENRTKEGLRTGVRTSGSTNSTPGWPSLHRAGPGEEKTHKKRSQRPRVSLSHVRVSLSLSLSSRLLGQHALTPQGCIFLYFLNKTDLSENYSMDCPRAVMQRALMSVTSNLCCDKTE